LGDIGKLFPDNDPAYAGADSVALLERVMDRIREEGYTLGNLDITVLCQRPKLAPHIPAMREKLAAACGAEVSRISIKATTEEGLGFTGSGEGIAAHCVCLLV
jgi:2-C-methyl-D-erythritol 2,4-cyclodiphosphate synthase